MKKNYKMPEFNTLEEEITWKRNNYHRDAFLSRASRAQKLMYPLSNPQKMVVRSNLGGYGFIVDEQAIGCFEPNLQKEKVREFIVSCTEMIKVEYSKKKREESENRHRCSYIMLKVALALILTGFAIFQYPIYVTISESNNIIYGGFVALFLALLITIGVIIRTLTMKRTRLDLNSHIHAKLSDFITRINGEFFNRFGYEASLGTEFFWIEIRVGSSRP